MSAPTLNDLARTATDALAAINLIQTAWADSAKRGGYAANFRDRPRISDDLLLTLYEEMVFFDAEAAETLSELRFQSEPTEADYKGYIAVTNEQWDYYTAQGVQP